MRLKKSSTLILIASTTLLSGCGWGMKEPLFTHHDTPVVHKVKKKQVQEDIDNSINGPVINDQGAATESVEQAIENTKHKANTTINNIQSDANDAVNTQANSISSYNGQTFFYDKDGRKTQLISKQVAILNPLIYPAKGGFLDCPHRGFVPFYKTGWTYDYVLHIKLSSLNISGYQSFGDEISVPVTTNDSWSSFIDFGNCSGYGLVAHWRKDTLNTGRIFIDYTFYANNAGVDTEISSTHTVEVNENTGHEVEPEEMSLNASSIQPGLQLSGNVTVTPGQNYKQIYYQNKYRPHYNSQGAAGFNGSFPGESGYAGTGALKFVDESVKPEIGGVGPQVR